jgi:hypothetical protein
MEREGVTERKGEREGEERESFFQTVRFIREYRELYE